TTLTYHQQLLQLAGQAESTLQVLNVDKETDELLNKNIICSMFEGNAPYRPRYIIPDYEKLFTDGCEFLDLQPPQDIWEATNNLLIFYNHVPSITSFPVFLGNLDTLFEPFIQDEKESYKAISLFLKHVERVFTDSFVHANIGPYETKAGRILLEVMNELNSDIPNLTLKYDKDKTSKEFTELCLRNAMNGSKPSFASHKTFTEDFGTERYAIASCYNGLLIGGGGHTLVRLVLSRLAEDSVSKEEFLENKVPYAVKKMLGYMDERIRFLTEETTFFKTNFLVKEEFIKEELFKGMFGVVGLAEAVNHMFGLENNKDRFGHSEAADEFGLAIIKKINEIVEAHGDHIILHSQVGIDTDTGISPGCRIPVGDEPEIFKHLIQSAPFHKYFKSGIGDIFVFEETYKNNLPALQNIVDGAFKSGMRYISLYGSDCDVVRVTGYLVKKSQVQKLEKGEVVKNNSTVFGMGAKNGAKAFERKLRV
ncbi:MAG: YjjI family glycine radical enzyme, partial [Fusobacteriaceae bacterium]